MPKRRWRAGASRRGAPRALRAARRARRGAARPGRRHERHADVRGDVRGRTALRRRSATTLDFLLVEVEPRPRRVPGPPALQHYNPLGTVHGGWFATLLDSAVGCAVHTHAARGRGYTTAELKINIVRAADRQGAAGARRRQGDSPRPAHGHRRGPAWSGPTASCTLTPPPPASCSTPHERPPHETPPHHAARRRPAALDRLLHQGDGHEAAAHSPRTRRRTTAWPSSATATNPEHAELELTYNHGVEPTRSARPTATSRIGVPDAYAACEKIRATAATSRARPGR